MAGLHVPEVTRLYHLYQLHSVQVDAETLIGYLSGDGSAVDRMAHHLIEREKCWDEIVRIQTKGLTEWIPSLE